MYHARKAQASCLLFGMSFARGRSIRRRRACCAGSGNNVWISFACSGRRACARTPSWRGGATARTRASRRAAVEVEHAWSLRGPWSDGSWNMLKVIASSASALLPVPQVYSCDIL